MGKRWLLLLASLGLLNGACRTLRGYAETDADAVKNPPPEWSAWSPAQRGGYLTTVSDFGCLTTDNLQLNAVPWKLLMALSDVAPQAFFGQSRHAWASTPGRPLQRFGIVYGSSIDNALGAPTQTPIGYAFGTVERTWPDVTLQIASTNCSACHTGRLWGADGRPLDRAFFGVANHSIDFDGLVTAVVQAEMDPRSTDEALLEAIARRFPATRPEELASYRRFVLPAFRKTIAERQATWGFLHPWHFGGPGFSHGAAILRDKLTDDRTPERYPRAQVKVPNIFGTAQKERILIDGSYTPLASSQHARLVQMLVGFLPVFGTPIERSVTQAPMLENVAAYLEQLKPPPFPGPIDAAAHDRGAAVFKEHCQRCHGTPDHYPNKPVSREKIGTDPTRGDAIGAVSLKAFNTGPIGDFMTIEPSDQYWPPPLNGVWAQAPYLHNGSVPTLYDLLHPQTRPAKFWVGGHALSLDKVGIALAAPGPDGACDYPPDYVPWSEPKLFDTSVPGNSNRGHERQVEDLSEQDKADVLEYLKGL
jgi:mono/diheme cytochrome c family protein